MRRPLLKNRPLGLTNAALRIGVKVLPAIPHWVKLLPDRGRSVRIDGNTLDPTVQLLQATQRITRTGGLGAAADVASAREMMRSSHVVMGTLVDVPTADLTIPGPDGPVRVRHYRPAVDGAPLLVFFHGGGFVLGDIESHDGLCRTICRDAAAHVLSVDYRLAPEHKAPAAVEDCLAAYRWALEHAAELGADPSRIGVGGDSAGGNLAALVAVRSRDAGIAAPVIQVLLYPVCDMGAETHSRRAFSEGFFLTRQEMDWFRDLYVGGSGIAADDARLSPLRTPDLSGLAPALVITAGFDPLRDEANAYAAALRSAGVLVDHRQFDGLAHGFASLAPFGGGSADAIRATTSAIRAHFSRGRG